MKLEVDLVESSIEDLQEAYSVIKLELVSRFHERAKSCDHPVESRGLIGFDRPGYVVDGCAFCLTMVKKEE